MSKETIPVIWGADAIGRAIGREASWVRKTLAKMPNTPVHRMPGKKRDGGYWAYPHDLRSFFDQIAGKDQLNPLSDS